MINKETIKQFLKPDWRKGMFFIVFIIINSFFLCHKVLVSGGRIKYCGFPLDCLKDTYIVAIGGFNSSLEFTGLFSCLANIIFWYLIACLVIFIYDKFKNRKK